MKHQNEKKKSITYVSAQNSGSGSDATLKTFAVKRHTLESCYCLSYEKLHTHVHSLVAGDVNDEPYAMILKAGMIDGWGWKEFTQVKASKMRQSHK